MYPVHNSLFKSHSWSGCFREEGNPLHLLGIEPHILQCIALSLNDLRCSSTHVHAQKKCVTRFTRMQDIQTPQKIKHLLIQNINYTVNSNFIHLIHKACQILPTFTNKCHCLYLHSKCLHLPHAQSQHSHPLYHHSTTYNHQFHPLHCIYNTC